MNRKIQKHIKNKLWQNREKKLWRRSLGILSAAAVMVTVGFLTLPAITLEKQDCGLEAHTHGESCYDAAGTLICTLPEHVHTADCGNVKKVQVCPETEHTHTAACYGPVMVLSCGKEEHAHSESCYDGAGNLICGKEEHTHGDSCYSPEKVLICKAEEHTHGKDCYEDQKVLTCTLEAHTHGESCYDEAGNLICGKEEHTHGEDCYTVKPVLICNKQEHTHSDACYQTRMELKCGLPEHTHTEECFRWEKIDPSETVPGTTEATVPGTTAEETVPASTEETVPVSTEETIPETTGETQPETLDPWDQALRDTPLTGSWCQDLVKIAQSQEGYTAGAEDLRFEKGFVRFCLQTAGIPSEKLLVNDSLGLWADALTEKKLVAAKEVPDLGDLVFTDRNGDTIADGVEIVTGVRIEDTPVSFTTILYNSEKGVHTARRAADNSDLLGFCDLGKLQEAQPEKKDLPIPEARNFTFEDETMTVEVRITGLTIRLPENTRLLVSRLEGKSLKNSPEMGLFDMKLLDGETPVVLNPEASVQVSVKLAQPLFAPEALEGNKELKTLVFDVPDPMQAMEETQGTTLAQTAETLEKLMTEAAEESTAAQTEAETQAETTANTQPAAAPAETQIETTASTQPAAAPAEAQTETPSGETEKKPSSPSAFVKSRPSAPQDPMPASTEATAPAAAETAPDYQEVEGTYGGVSQGVTELKFTANGISPFGIMVKTAAKPVPKYWKTVYSPEELTEGCQIMIQTVLGNHVLGHSDEGQVTAEALDLMAVDGHRDYFQTNSTSVQTAVWEYVGGGLCYRGPKGDKYLHSGSKSSKPLSLNTKKENVTIKLLAHPKCWTVKLGGKMIGIDNGEFIGEGKDNTVHMHVYIGSNKKLDPPPELGVIGGGEAGQKPVKPVYPGYIVPSEAKATECTVPDQDRPASPVTVKAASDPSTSQLESLFGSHKEPSTESDYERQKVDNGKALADKSVVYGKDDYSAFMQYDPGTFSVALSALGQSTTSEKQNIQVPLDVMFILDTSGSMTEPMGQKNSEEEKAKSKTRAEALVQALNSSISQVFAVQKDGQGQSIPNYNRVSVVGYSTESEVLLDMGKYSCDKNKAYFSVTGQEKKQVLNAVCEPIADPNSTSKGKVVKTTRDFYGATYTQHGIARGADAMLAVPDKTLILDGMTITRKPLIILISDGEPTLCTSDYTDVIGAPVYGSGMGTLPNAQGVQGYYTILSANYYKRLVSYSYGTAAPMYTIGIDMATKDSSTSGKDSVASLHYKATVLEPSADNIQMLSSYKQGQTIGPQMQSLLNGQTLESREIELDANDPKWYPKDVLGSQHSPIPVILDNPYRAVGYNYADKAYRSTNPQGLMDSLTEIITQNQAFMQLPYKTKPGTNIHIDDPIGKGMIVKGDPVLRVAGKNYTPISKETIGQDTIYHYAGEVSMDSKGYINLKIDMKDIVVKVSDDGTGKQTVHMEIPPKCLPVYTPDSTQSFYLEALPIRLLYQVGLPVTIEEYANTMKPGDTAEFFTNDTQNGGAQAKLAVPKENTYFSGTETLGLNETKKSNPTNTAADSRKTTKSSSAEGTSVTQALGNNGKLTFKKPGNPPELTVKKTWLDADGKPINPDSPGKIVLPEKIEFHLKRTYVDKAGKTHSEYYMDETNGSKKKTFQLPDHKNWEILIEPDKGTWNIFPRNDKPGDKPYTPYKYYVEELPQDDFHTTYQNNGVQPTPDNHAVTITVTNQYKYGDLVLPHTGGMGTGTILGAGLFLILGTLLFMFVQERKPKEGRRG